MQPEEQLRACCTVMLRILLGHFAIDFAVGMELQVEQAAEAGSPKDTKEKARGDTKNLELPRAGPAVPDLGLEHCPAGAALSARSDPGSRD